MTQSPPTTTATGDADLRALVAPIWSRRWLVLMIAVLATAATYAYYSGKPDQYRSSAVLYIAGGSDADSILYGVPAPQGTDRNVQNQAVLLNTDAVAANVAKRIEFRGNPRVLLNNVDSKFESGQDFLTITATSSSAAQAALLADSFARAFIDLRSAETRTTVQRALNVATRQLRELGPSSRLSGQRDALQQSVSRLKSAISTSSGAVRLLNPAAVPNTPFAPQPMRNALFALVIALALAIALSYLLDRVDRRLRALEDVESAYGSPVISVVPHARTPAAFHDGRPIVAKEFRESFRSLHANIRLLTLDEPIRSILVTSALPSEGKSTVARNLALTLCEWGLEVALIEADLRRPVLSEALGVQPEHGLTHVLSGKPTVEDALVDVRPAVQSIESLTPTAPEHATTSDAEPVVSSDGRASNGSFCALRLLAAGRESANPQAVIASSRMSELLSQLKRQHDVVVIDSSPLLAVSDALPLFAQVDGCVLVSRVGVSTRDSAQRALEVIRRIPNAELLGVVANDVEAGSPTVNNYGYGYGYGDDESKTFPAGRGKTEPAAPEANPVER